MKKTKFFMAIGTLVLACGAFAAAKPNKKFTGIAANFHSIGASGAEINLSVTSTDFTYVARSGHTVLLKTAGGSKLATLLTGTSASDKVYAK